MSSSLNHIGHGQCAVMAPQPMGQSVGLHVNYGRLKGMQHEAKRT